MKKRAETETYEINSIVSMYKKPVLGTENQKDSKRYMALCIDSSSRKPYRGIARQVIERKGNVDIPGFVDRSKLILVESKDLLKWKVIREIQIKGIDEIIKKFGDNERYFIGLEDPDIFVDENGKKHVYFTIAYKYKNRKGHKLFLGHAEGSSLENLVATNPVVVDNKEIAISPIKNNYLRFVLAESWRSIPEEGISLLKAKSMSKKWKFDRLVFNPKKHGFPWCAGYASPCRIINPSLISIKNNLFLGICTGNSGKYKKNGKKYRGYFKPGLFLFNPETGKIPWIDDEPLFEDPKATTITFASDFVQTSKDKGILYCQVNDSFVRAYEINAKALKKYLNEKVDLE